MRQKGYPIMQLVRKWSIALIICYIGLMHHLENPIYSQSGTPNPLLPPDLQVITAKNVDELTQLSVLGQGWLNEVTWSPNGQRLALASAAGVWIYNVNNFETSPTLLSSYHNVTTTVDFSPDGNIIAGSIVDLVTEESTIILWSFETGEELSTLNSNQHRIIDISFSPDGALLASGDGRRIVIWDIATLTEKLSLEGSGPVQFSPDGEYLAIANRRSVEIWDWENDILVATLSSHNAPITNLKFDSGGTRLASSSSTDNTVSIWDIETMSLYKTLQSDTRTTTMDFAPNGNVVAAGGETVQLFDANTSEVLAVLSVVNSANLRFSPDGSVLATIDIDGAVYLWNVASFEEIDSLPGAGRHWLLEKMAFNTDDTLILSIWGDRIVDTGATVRYWNLQTGDEEDLTLFTGVTVGPVALDPVARRVAFNLHDSLEIHIYDIDSDTTHLVLPAQLERVSGIDFSHDGNLLAAMSFYDPLYLWDITTGERVLELPVTAGRGLLFSPDSSLLAVGSLSLWDLSARENLWTIVPHIRSEMTSLVFSPDGSKLASAGRDGTVYLWDLATGERLVELNQSGPAITGLAFHPSEPLLAGGRVDGIIQFWDTIDGLEVASINAHPFHLDGAIDGLTFNSSGTILASGGKDRTIRLWGIHSN